MEILMRVNDRRELLQKVKASPTLVSYSLRFKCNSFLAQRIRHLAMNCCCGILLN